MARAKSEAPLSIEDICASAKNRGGYTGSYEDLAEHARIFIRETVCQLLDGFSVQMGGFFSIHTRVSGTYHGAHGHIGADNQGGADIDRAASSANRGLLASK